MTQRKTRQNKKGFELVEPGLAIKIKTQGKERERERKQESSTVGRKKIEELR